MLGFVAYITEFVRRFVNSLICNFYSGIGRNLKSLCNPDYNKVREALKSAGASTELIHKIHTGLTSSQVKDVYDLYSHCFMGAVSDRKLQLIYLLKNIMASLMAR